MGGRDRRTEGEKEGGREEEEGKREGRVSMGGF